LQRDRLGRVPRCVCWGDRVRVRSRLGPVAARLVPSRTVGTVALPVPEGQLMFVLGNALSAVAVVVSAVVIFAVFQWIKERDRRGER